MVLQAEPIIKAVEFAKLKDKNKKTKVIIFSAIGKQFDNKTAIDLAKKYNQLILICGRYEGIDARVKKIIKDQGLKIEEISIGPYVLTGGELPAMVLIDSVSRQISGVLGNIESLEEGRYGLPVYPVRGRTSQMSEGRLRRSASNGVYTRPEIFAHKGKKYKTPKVLLSGNHKKIEEWNKSHKLTL